MGKKKGKRTGPTAEQLVALAVAGGRAMDDLELCAALARYEVGKRHGLDAGWFEGLTLRDISAEMSAALREEIAEREIGDLYADQVTATEAHATRMLAKRRALALTLHHPERPDA